MFSFVLCSVMLISLSANAATQTIDFEELSLGQAAPAPAFGGGPLVSNGFSFSGFGFSVFESERWIVSVGENGTQSLGLSLFGGRVDEVDPFVQFGFNRPDGLSFALIDIDFLATYVVGGADQGPVFLTGALTGGGTVSSETTAIGTGGWLAVDSVGFNVTGVAPFFVLQEFDFEVDNIVVSVVPIPAAVWLFASALGLLGFRSRLSSSKFLAR